MQPKTNQNVTKNLNNKYIIYIILTLILIHAFLLFNYGTASPCKAAAKRIVNDKYDQLEKPTSQAGALGRAAGRYMSEGIVYALTYAKIKEEPLTSCYAIALKISNKSTK